jgi:UDP-glucose 4-epimerase
LARRTVKGKRVVVTGGAGFIGSHLCDRIIEEGPARLAIVDNFSLGKERNIRQLLGNKRVAVYREDASVYESMRRVLAKERAEVVFNLAVIPLPMSLELPMQTIETNISITACLCELQRKRAFQTLVHCSSSEAYGTALYVPMDEKHPERPLTPYAASKIACDHIATSYYTTFGGDISIARPFNAYGPRQNDRSYAGVIPVTIKRIMEGEPPVIFGDGEQTRDYTYVEDIVNGILGVFRTEEARGKIINIASGREVTIRHLVETIADLMGFNGEIQYKPPRPGDVLRHRGNISLAKELFGFSPKVDFGEGLKKTVEWYTREPGSRGKA